MEQEVKSGPAMQEQAAQKPEPKPWQILINKNGLDIQGVGAPAWAYWGLVLSKMAESEIVSNIVKSAKNQSPIVKP